MSVSSVPWGLGDWSIWVTQKFGHEQVAAEPWWKVQVHFNTLRPRHHFPDEIFKSVFIKENVWILVKIWIKFVLRDSVNSIPSLLQIMPRHWRGDKALSEPLVSLLMHIYITWPQWANKVMWNKGWFRCKSVILAEIFCCVQIKLSPKYTAKSLIWCYYK